MQAMINVDDAFGPNLNFDPKKPVTKANWPERHVPSGTVINHPDCYLLCRGSDPRAEPHDDECKAIHAEYLQQREAGLAERAAAEQADEQSDAEQDADAGDAPPRRLKPRGKRAAANETL